MKTVNILNSILDFIELMIRWSLVWFFIIGIIVLFCTFLLYGIMGFDSQLIRWGILTLLAVLVLTALYDLTLRVRGKNNIIYIVSISRSATIFKLVADKTSTLVESCITLLITFFGGITKLVIIILILMLLALGVYLLYQGLAMLPISIAIIIGALIIASALK